MATILDIALTQTPGLGANGIAHLLEIFSTAEKIFSATPEELMHYAELNPSIAKSITNRIGVTAANEEWEYCKRNNITPLASTDAEYPQLLLEINDRPHIIYVRGNINILNNRAVSIVGTRKITPYGKRACEVIIKEIAECVPNAVIVSGLAFGVDSAVHRAALQYGVPTIAVLPSPLNDITPAQHTSLANEIVAAGGAIITEVHSKVKHNGRLYISRNRIIAGYSGATIIAESPKSGGAMSTANIAHGYNRIVGAVPGRITDIMSEGCNKLIASRIAIAILSGADIIKEMMWDLEGEVKPRADISPLQFDTNETIVFKCFQNDDALTLDSLIKVSRLPIGELSAALFNLEISEAVRQLPGCKYERLIPLNMVK